MKIRISNLDKLFSLYIRTRVKWTLQMQAILQSILAFLLGVHTGEWHDTPRWAAELYDGDGWRALD